MSWTRYDDLFTEWPVWDELSYETRWHYMALVQAASRQRRWDGRLPLTRALRASDVPDPSKCMAELERAGLVQVVAETVYLPGIHEHIPPPSVRKNAEQSKVRMRRMRRHKAGDHTLCLPENCPDADVTAAVTRNTGTGRDGTGTTTGDLKDSLEEQVQETVTSRVTRDDPWEATS